MNKIIHYLYILLLSILCGVYVLGAVAIFFLKCLFFIVIIPVRRAEGGPVYLYGKIQHLPFNEWVVISFKKEMEGDPIYETMTESNYPK